MENKYKIHELLKSFSLRTRMGTRNGPMPHYKKLDYNVFYVWNDLNDHLELSKILNKNVDYFKYKSNYITVSDLCYDKIASYFIRFGPNSHSSSLTIRFLYTVDNKIRVILSGWGSSFSVIYEGDLETLTNYFKEYQKEPQLEENL